MFFFIIDEWDAICREFPDRQKMKGDPATVVHTILDEYVMLLRRLFKTQDSDEVFYLLRFCPFRAYTKTMAHTKPRVSLRFALGYVQVALSGRI